MPRSELDDIGKYSSNTTAKGILFGSLGDRAIYSAPDISACHCLQFGNILVGSAGSGPVVRCLLPHVRILFVEANVQVPTTGSIIPWGQMGRAHQRLS